MPEAVVMPDEPITPAEAEWMRLPGGPERTIRVLKGELGNRDGKPFLVCEAGEPEQYAGVVIEGPSRLVHDPERMLPGGNCGLAYLLTTAPLLVPRA